MTLPKVFVTFCTFSTLLLAMTFTVNATELNTASEIQTSQPEATATPAADTIEDTSEDISLDTSSDDLSLYSDE